MGGASRTIRALPGRSCAGIPHGGRGVTATQRSVAPQSRVRSPSIAPSPCSATDSAPASGAGGCRFKSCQGRKSKAPVAQSDRAPVYDTGGCEFESRLGRQKVSVAQSEEAAGLKPATVRVQIPSETHTTRPAATSPACVAQQDQSAGLLSRGVRVRIPPQAPARTTHPNTPCPGPVTR